MDKTISTMVKKVNIHAPIPIRDITPNLYGDYKNLMMSPANILKCLIHRAIVHEVLSDGTLVMLTQKNYNTNNEPAKTPVSKEDKLQSAVTKEDKVENNGKVVKGDKKEEKKASEVPVEDKKEEKVEEEKPSETLADKSVEDNLAEIATPDGEEKIEVKPGKVTDPPIEITNNDKDVKMSVESDETVTTVSAEDKKEEKKESAPTYKPKKTGKKS